MHVAIMSKRKQEEGPRCPLCRLPLYFGEIQEPFTITSGDMTYYLNKYGGGVEELIDPVTKKFEAPKLQSGQIYAKHPLTMDAVQMTCRIQGPHQCQTVYCVEPFCNASLTREGCKCDEKPWSVKKKLREALSSADEEQQSSIAKEQPGPKFFKNNEFDSIPDQ